MGLKLIDGVAIVACRGIQWFTSTLSEAAKQCGSPDCSHQCLCQIFQMANCTMGPEANGGLTHLGQREETRELFFFSLQISCDSVACDVFLGYSRMRGKGSRFTLGVWGLRVCSLDVAFMFATVRNRPQPFM